MGRTQLVFHFITLHSCFTLWYISVCIYICMSIENYIYVLYIYCTQQLGQILLCSFLPLFNSSPPCLLVCWTIILEQSLTVLTYCCFLYCCLTYCCLKYFCLTYFCLTCCCLSYYYLTYCCPSTYCCLSSYCGLSYNCLHTMALHMVAFCIVALSTAALLTVALHTVDLRTVASDTVVLHTVAYKLLLTCCCLTYWAYQLLGT